mmetsp:Transcript_7598/g.8828  ORF Transcript_7598/g.8828 Transcript_7598/m.8828 type:complete len:288 (-) Transcript_7598:1134-1997(-)
MMADERRLAAIGLVIEGFNIAILDDLPAWTAAEKSGLIDRPRGHVADRTRHVEIAVLGNVRIIERAVSYLVIHVDIGIEVINGVPEFVSDNDLALAFLGLLYEIHHHDGTSVALHQILEMLLSRVVGRIDAVEDNGRFGHGDARFLRPVGRNRSAHLQEGREGSSAALARGNAAALVVHDLFVLNVVGHLAPIAHPAFEIPGSGEMTAAACHEDEIDGTAVIVHLLLHECSVYNGEDPIPGAGRTRIQMLCSRSAALVVLLQLSGEEVIPRVHFLEGRRWIGLTRHG